MKILQHPFTVGNHIIAEFHENTAIKTKIGV